MNVAGGRELGYQVCESLTYSHRKHGGLFYEREEADF